MFPKLDGNPICMKRRLCALALWVICLLPLHSQAQNIYQDRQFQFISFEAIPTWTGVAVDWDKAAASIHLYDSERYKGHAQYISVALKTGITFAQFKEQVKHPAKRKYMPFFLFDLRKEPPVIGGKSYTWAVRIEDYAYQDNAAQMTEATLRLLRTVTDYIREATGLTSNGIIILSTNPQSQPNVQIAPALNQAGFPNRTVSQLIALMGGKSVHILNNGTGYGYLKYIPAGEEDDYTAMTNDIVVYAEMPDRVPPVNGIITLEPQTPLSHVNLLAKNRGTFNLYALDTASIPGLHAHMGQLVRMDCGAQRITLHTATLAEAQRHWDAHRRTITLPTADATVARIIDLGAPAGTPLTANVVGAKAANYAILQAKLPQYVKPGMAIPFYYYRQVLQSSKAAQEIDAWLKRAPTAPPDEIPKALASIRKTILASHVDPELLKALKSVMKAQYAGRRIRLRSSTNCEDLPGFNGAGLYLSKGIDPDESVAELEEKILEIYASLWTPIAYAERAYYGIDHAKAAMAILINEAYSNEYANGVILTIPDKSGYAVAINTQWGDAAVTNPENGQIPEAILFKSATSNSYTTESRSNIHDVFLQPGLEPLLLEVKAASVAIHQALTAQYAPDAETAYGVDIEFKIVEEDGRQKLYIKQARPLGQVLPE